MLVAGKAGGLGFIGKGDAVEAGIGHALRRVGIDMGPRHAGAGRFDQQLGVVVGNVVMRGAGARRTGLRQTGAADKAGVQLVQPLAMSETRLQERDLAAIAVIVFPLVEGRDGGSGEDEGGGGGGRGAVDEGLIAVWLGGAEGDGQEREEGLLF